ncbi:MAG: MmgE/PrpD family protein [Deltaproteobacteria bacterium]|nr:MmgE/PrpD family protein [Deltaproteobacteria bacterium]
MNVTQKLAEFCSELTFNALSSPTVEAAKQLTLDFLGVAARGATADSSRIMIETIKPLAGPGNAVTIAGNCCMPPQYAALINGTFGHALDYDDVCNVASLHPGVAVFPSALAVTQLVNGEGKDFLLAAVLGYEVMCRLGKALGPAKHYGRGFHPTATCGTFGAAASAGRLLGMDSKRLANAFGIAGSQTSGSMEFLAEGAWTKRMHPGWAAQSGVIAAFLAQNGFKGPTTIFEGRDGFLNSYSTDTNPEELIESLGDAYFVRRTSVKPHSCCRYKHSPIDGITTIIRENNLSPDDIDTVTLGILDVAFPIIIEPETVKYNPQNVVDAQFSMPFGAAVAILFGNATPNEYTDEKVNSPAVHDMMKKIRIVKDPALNAMYPEKWPASVEIHTKAGNSYRTFIEYPKGDPENPLNWEELTEKFKKTTRIVYNSNAQQEIIQQVKHLEELKDLSRLFQLLNIQCA